MSKQPSVPDTIIVGYLQGKDRGLIDQIPTGYNVINIAFGLWENDGTATYNVEITKDDVTALKKAGRNVLLSFGGERALPFNVTDVQAFSKQFVATATKICKDHGFDGIDLDIENIAGNLNNNIHAMEQIVIGMGKNGFLVTMAPQVADIYPGPPLVAVSAGWNRYAPLVAVGSEAVQYVSWEQTQLYNAPGTTIGGADQGTKEFAINDANALLKGFDIPWDGKTLSIKLPADKIVLGFPATTEAAGSGYLDPSAIVEAFAAISPQVRGVMTWDIGWDAGNNWEFVNMVSKILK